MEGDLWICTLLFASLTIFSVLSRARNAAEPGKEAGTYAHHCTLHLTEILPHLAAKKLMAKPFRTCCPWLLPAECRMKPSCQATSPSSRASSCSVLMQLEQPSTSSNLTIYTLYPHQAKSQWKSVFILFYPLFIILSVLEVANQANSQPQRLASNCSYHSYLRPGSFFLPGHLREYVKGSYIFESCKHGLGSIVSEIGPCWASLRFRNLYFNKAPL